MSRPSLRLALCAALAATPGLAGAQPVLAGAPLRGSFQPVNAPLAPATDAGAPAAFPLRAPTPAQTIRVGTGASAVRTLSLPRGKSAVIDLPVDARDVMVSNPKVADVALSTPRRIYVMGEASGQTDATFVDGMGRQILRLDIRVDQDASALQQTLSRLLPGAAIHVDSANDSIILSGEAANPAEADKAARLAAAFVSDPKQVVNMIAVAGAEQVMLQVKIVEVNRTILKQLGFNLNALTGQLGMPQYSFLNSPTYGVNGSYLGGLQGGYRLNTTSQPVSAFPGLSSIPGLSQAAGLISGATALGIPAAAVGQAISSFLTGVGPALTTPQTSYIQNYVSGSLGTFQTQITPNVIVGGVPTAAAPFTATASLEGITPSNIQQYEKAFINGGNVNGAALTSDQRVFLQAFNSSVAQNYNSAGNYSLSGAQDSLFRDRSNPANYVQTNTAGSTGLNQANAIVQAFERVGLVRTLAEPNLTAISGESANFLAGGEFPVPVGQDNNGRVTIEFKQYGVGLGFTPVVLSSGRISLKISTEVSELTNVGGFTLSNNNALTGTAGPSLTVPALNVRRANTVVELPSGGAMAIAGLMQSQTKETLDSLPGLMQLPVVGALLRSRDFQQNESELVVIVTPYLVKPVRPDQLSTPADGLQIADDLQTNLLGRINTGFNKPPAKTAGQTYQGPFGYVVD